MTEPHKKRREKKTIPRKNKQTQNEPTNLANGVIVPVSLS